MRKPIMNIMLIRVNELGRTGFSLGWQGYSLGFSSGSSLRKSLRTALPALIKPRPSLLFYLD